MYSHVSAGHVTCICLVGGQIFFSNLKEIRSAQAAQETERPKVLGGVSHI